MDLSHVVGGGFVRDMPAAIVAGGHFGEAVGTVQRPTPEKLLQPAHILGGDAFEIQRKGLQLLAALAGPSVLFGDDWLVMSVQPARHHAGAGTQRAGHAALCDDGTPNELAFVRQVVEKIGKFLLDFEGDDFGFPGFPGGCFGFRYFASHTSALETQKEIP